MLTIDSYHRFMKTYIHLVNEHYKEPGIKMFDDVTTSVIRALVSDESEFIWVVMFLKITCSIYWCTAMNINIGGYLI